MALIDTVKLGTWIFYYGVMIVWSRDLSSIMMVSRCTVPPSHYPGSVATVALTASPQLVANTGWGQTSAARAH